MKLRAFLKRVAWGRSLIIIGSLCIGYFLFTNESSIKVPSPSFSVPDLPDSPVFSLCVLGIILIFMLGVIKIIKRGRDE